MAARFPDVARRARVGLGHGTPLAALPASGSPVIPRTPAGASSPVLATVLARAAARSRAAVAWCRPRLARHRLQVAAAVIGLLGLATAAFAHHLLHADRSGTPDLEAFIRFEPPTIGEIQ